MITTATNPFTGEVSFSWSRKDQSPLILRRISGGIGWPGGGLPGVVCVAGEVNTANADFPDQHDVHVLGEWEDFQGENFLAASSLFQAMAAAQRVCRVQEWWCQERPEFDSELRDFNRSRAASRKPGLRLQQVREDVTPEWLNMRVHLRTSARKTLFLHRADAARQALHAMGRDFSAVTWRTSPAATALLMALYPLEARPYAGPMARSGTTNAGWAT